MADDLAHLDRRIASAWAALAGARAAATHSPNADTCGLEDICENTVNALLERRHEMTASATITR